ncbi:hypothetical protein HDK90DRAFT_491646, partial [Phyllosticta capitalensis]
MNKLTVLYGDVPARTHIHARYVCIFLAFSRFLGCVCFFTLLLPLLPSLSFVLFVFFTTLSPVHVDHAVYYTVLFQLYIYCFASLCCKINRLLFDTLLSRLRVGMVEWDYGDLASIDSIAYAVV